MKNVLTPEERRHIDELLKKHRPKPTEEKVEEQKEMTAMSEKGMKIIIKSEAAGLSTKLVRKELLRNLKKPIGGNMN